MKNLKKRIASIITAAAVAFSSIGVLPDIPPLTGFVVPASAEPTTHEHNGITFQPWTSDNSLPDSAGSYYLTEDVTIGSTWNVPSGTVNLDLNGHSIKITGSGTVILVPQNATLNMYDSGTGEHK